ncbi:serine/threonine protein kinase [Labilithrix luteola]|uniref:Serine/threonine protein kinase n=1 Tax=Labilithrix luteola TaxID=1391654 RepID=A0A0K1PTC8_9BACT|nr:serine/threonine protein kinase [Labilithrix luteola]
MVAIKVLHQKGRDAAPAERLAREARLAARILHPNVCPVLDAGRHEDGSPFLVMERLYGETLRARLARLRRMDPEDCIELGVQMLSGLEAAHDLGVLHRDMKPENVFIVPQETGPFTVKILDFGMCRGTASIPLDDRTLTVAGTVVGTPEYMSPEQAGGRRDFDQRVDLYSVGIMLYEALSGTRAFQGSDPRSVLVAVLTKKIPPLRSIDPNIPFALERVIVRATERDPRARYATAGEFLHDLLEARTSLRRQRAHRAIASETIRTVSPFTDLADLDATTRQLNVR